MCAGQRKIALTWRRAKIGRCWQLGLYCQYERSIVREALHMSIRVSVDLPSVQCRVKRTASLTTSSSLSLSEHNIVVAYGAINWRWNSVNKHLGLKRFCFFSNHITAPRDHEATLLPLVTDKNRGFHNSKIGTDLGTLNFALLAKLFFELFVAETDLCPLFP